MVSALSYIIAVVITMCLAIVLYPISALFWILGLFGKIADLLFDFTTKLIRSLWQDIGKMNRDNNGEIPSENQK